VKRLTRKQVAKLRKKLDREGYADIRIGECRAVSRGVKVCRTAKTVYKLAAKRPGSSRALRREAAAQGTYYI
jgi:hypothetical protein